MIGSSMSTIVIFIPFEMMSGVAGAYFKVMTNTMIMILVCSFFVTWIFLPVVYLLLTRLSRETRKKDVNQVEVKKQRWVAFVIHKPYISFVIVPLLAIAIGFILPQLQTGFSLEVDEGR